jgi:arylsulfatase A-like enzyme
MPTVAELVGIEMPPQSCVGASLVPALRDRETDSGPEFYVSESFYGKRGMVYNVDWHRLWQYGRKISFQNRQLKLIVDCSRDTCRAFDLRRDPRETNDLVPARPELARIARGLARLHLRAAERIRIRRRVGRPGPRAGPNETPQ